MKITTVALHRLTYNARIFQAGKTAPPMKLLFDEDGIVVMSIYDRLTYLEDSAEYEMGDFQQYIEFSASETKALEFALRSIVDEKEPLALTLREGVMKVEVMGIEVGSYEFGYPERDLDDISSLVDEDYFQETKSTPQALNPDRFRKLSLVQPGDYPVDFWPVDHEKFGPIVAFKKGPTVVGALSVVNRTILSEQPGSEEFLW